MKQKVPGSESENMVRRNREVLSGPMISFISLFESIHCKVGGQQSSQRCCFGYPLCCSFEKRLHPQALYLLIAIIIYADSNSLLVAVDDRPLCSAPTLSAPRPTSTHFGAIVAWGYRELLWVRRRKEIFGNFIFHCHHLVDRQIANGATDCSDCINGVCRCKKLSFGPSP